jgi:hypothetical protein
MLSKNVFSCSIVGKRKAETLESSQPNVSMSDRHHPSVEGVPLFTFDVHVGNKVFKAATMPDSGATVCMANVNFINHYSVPEVKRD